MAQFDTQFDSQLFKAVPEQKRYSCMVTDWEKKDGTKAMLLIRFFENHYQVGGMDWGYTISALSSNSDAFEIAKNACIYSLLYFWINPQWVQANNTYWFTMSQQSAAAHNQRMADPEAQGQAIIQRG